MSKSRYEIIRKIGVGAMGEVWLAKDIKLQRKVALKFMTTSIEADKEYMRQMMERMHGEAQFGAILNHPNIVQIYDFNRWKYDQENPFSNRMYIAMEYVKGITLKSIISKSPRLNILRIINIGIKICEALTHAHDQGVFHRDIKPSNLKLTPSGLIKLVDFGLVKLLASEEMTITILQGRGTALYTPLEQYGGDTGHTDVRSDIYAFGATLYHLLTSTAPVEARQRFLRPESLVPPRQINPDISVRTERAILWALNLHPDERPQNIEEFRQSLVGRVNPVTQPRQPLPKPSLADLVGTPVDRILMALAILMVIVSFLVTALY